MTVEKNNLPKFWEEFLSTQTGLPFVELSMERVLDNRYHQKASRHDHFEIVYVQKGEAVFEINGQTVEVGKKDLLVIKPHHTHRLIIREEESCSLVTLYFNFQKQGGNPILLEEFLYDVGDQEFGAYIPLSSVYKHEIVNALTRITTEMNQPDADSEFLCSLMAMEIFVWLSRALKRQWERSVNRNEKKLQEIMESSRQFILEHYNSEVGLNDIANSVYLSPSHFARVFKKFYQVSPIQYLLTTRIEEAKKLLTDTSLKISDISFDVGFSAQQRFNDIFKKQVGMSPSEYRKTYQRT